MSHNRMQRIGDEIQHHLAQLLLTKIHDPRLNNVSITAVSVSPDMANATILISALDEKQIEEILTALNKAAGFFRKELARSLNFRITPRLKFAHDKSILRANHLINLINTVNREPSTDE